MSNYPNRCEHIKVNGIQCGSPALRHNRFCFFHKRYHDKNIQIATENARSAKSKFTLPVFEDANSIQITLMEVIRMILSHQIDCGRLVGQAHPFAQNAKRVGQPAVVKR